MKKPPKTATQKIRRAQAVIQTLNVTAYITLALTALIQLLFFYSLRRNIELGTLYAADAETIQKAFPLWYIAMPLWLFGVIWSAVWLRRERRGAALPGIGCGLAASVLFVLFSLSLYEVFHYNVVYEHGLTVWALIWRHLSPLVPVLLNLAAWIVAGVLHKKRDVADMMTRLAQTDAKSS